MSKEGDRPIKNSAFQSENVDVGKLKSQLLELKRAIVNRDREAIKAFFRFPVSCSENEIWYHALTDKDLNTDEKKEFTERDFDDYFDKLFPQEFTEYCRELNIDTLIHTSNFSTVPAVNDGSFNQVHFNLSPNELSVNWYAEFKSEENPDMPFEYSVVYFFGIDEKKTISFKVIRLAG